MNTQRAVIDNRTFDGLNFERTDGANLDGELTGCRVLGVEAIDYPLTDGLIFYLEAPTGERFALEVGQEPCPLATDEDDGGLYIRTAALPSGCIIHGAE